MLGRLTGDPVAADPCTGGGTHDADQTPTGEECLQQEQLPLVRLMRRLCSVDASCGRSLMKIPRVCTTQHNTTRAGVHRSCSDSVLELSWGRALKVGHFCAVCIP